MRLSKKDTSTIRAAIQIAIESELDLIAAHAKCRDETSLKTAERSRQLIADFHDLRKRLPKHT